MAVACFVVAILLFASPVTAVNNIPAGLSAIDGARGTLPSVPPNLRGQASVPAQPLQSGYILPANYLDYFEIHDHSNGMKLSFTISASADVDIYVMNSAQFQSCCVIGQNNQALYHWQSASLSQEVSLPTEDTYYLVVFDDLSSFSVTFHLSLSTSPVDIYAVAYAPAPIGIADYGIQNVSGNLLPYEETASEVVGKAVINNIAAYNQSNSSPSSPYGAGLQLNVMLEVNTTQSRFAYWLQNTMTFDTNNNTDNFVSNVWNASSPTSEVNPNYISPPYNVESSSQGRFYAFLTPFLPYTNPTTVKLYINIYHSGGSVNIDFGYKESEGGQPLGSAITYYDNSTITEPNAVNNAAIVVDGYHMSPDNRFLDAEFVFAGDCCLARTTFTEMDSSISMYYVLQSGSVVAPKTVYGFGGDTGEAAYNLVTTFTQGEFHVGIGTPDFGSSFSPPPIVLVPIRASYSTGDGSTMPSPPLLHFVAMGDEVTVALTSSPATFQVDPGTQWFTSSVVSGGAGERWVSSGTTNGTASGSQSVSLVYTHQFMVTFQVSGSGTVNPSTGWYTAGQLLSVSSTANPGWKLSEWVGTGDGSYSGPSNSTSITINGAITEDVTYLAGFTISAGADGSVTYSFGSVSGTVSTGTSQTVYLPPGTSVRLSAQPSSGYQFNRWQGISNSTSSTIQEVVNSPSTIQASFSGGLLYLVLGVGFVLLIALVLAFVGLKRRHRRRPAPHTTRPPMPSFEEHPSDTGASEQVAMRGETAKHSVAPPPSQTSTTPPSPSSALVRTEAKLVEGKLPGSSGRSPAASQGGRTEVSAVQTSQGRTEAPTKEGVTVLGKKYCPSCGTQMETDYLFCPNCGRAQLARATPSTVLSSAGLANSCSFCHSATGTNQLVECELCHRKFCRAHSNPLIHECSNLRKLGGQWAS